MSSERVRMVAIVVVVAMVLAGMGTFLGVVLG